MAKASWFDALRQAIPETMREWVFLITSSVCAASFAVAGGIIPGYVRLQHLPAAQEVIRSFFVWWAGIAVTLASVTVYKKQFDLRLSLRSDLDNGRDRTLPKIQIWFERFTVNKIGRAALQNAYVLAFLRVSNDRRDFEPGRTGY